MTRIKFYYKNETCGPHWMTANDVSYFHQCNNDTSQCHHCNNDTIQCHHYKMTLVTVMTVTMTTATVITVLRQHNLHATSYPLQTILHL